MFCCCLQNVNKVIIESYFIHSCLTFIQYLHFRHCFGRCFLFRILLFEWYEVNTNEYAVDTHNTMFILTKNHSRRQSQNLILFNICPPSRCLLIEFAFSIDFNRNKEKLISDNRACFCGGFIKIRTIRQHTSQTTFNPPFHPQKFLKGKHSAA